MPCAGLRYYLADTWGFSVQKWIRSRDGGERLRTIHKGLSKAKLAPHREALSTCGRLRPSLLRYESGGLSSGAGHPTKKPGL